MADSEDANTPTTSGREVPEGYKVLTEGKGSILQKGNDVFYNPAQARLVPALGYACVPFSVTRSNDAVLICFRWSTGTFP